MNYRSSNKIKISSIDYCDKIIAVILFFLSFFLAAMGMNYGCAWGDDFAAYLNEGVAIAENRFEEQMYLNYLMHPIDFMLSSTPTRVYSWGYPLLLSIVYRILGFNRDDYSTIIWYKLPSVIAIAVLSATLFLLYKKRFGRCTSITASLLFCFSGCEFVRFSNNLYSDLVFLAWEIMAVSLSERRVFSEKVSIVGSILFSIVLFFVCETRSVGWLIEVILIIQTITHIRLERDKRYLKWQFILERFAPFLCSIVGCFIFEHFVFAPVTSEARLIGTDFSQTIYNLKTYLLLMADWFSNISTIFSFPRFGVITVIGGLILAGIVSSWNVEEHSYLIFVILYFAGNCLLPYTQGLRYCYPILPFLFLYCLYGMRTVTVWLSRISTDIKGKTYCVKALELFLALTCIIQTVQYDYSNIFNNRQGDDSGAYSPCAKQMYSYIMKHTENDAVIGFYAARALFLNTGRLSVATEQLYTLEELDYILISDELPQFDTRILTECFKEIYSIGGLCLYKNNLNVV